MNWYCNAFLSVFCRVHYISFNSISVYSIPFFSVLFYSILFYPIPSYSFFILFHSFSSILDHLVFFFLFILVAKISAMLFDSFLSSNHFANCEYTSLGEACCLEQAVLINKIFLFDCLKWEVFPLELVKCFFVFFNIFTNNSCLENYQVMVEPWSCE